MEAQGRTHSSVAAALVAINRRARQARVDLMPALELLGADLELEIIDVDDASEMVAKLRAAYTDDVGSIIVGGGDGTINSVLPLLLEKGAPLGILPLGTANDLARTLGLPADPLEAAKVIAAGRTRRIDVGSVNGRYFVNAAGIGFSTTLHRELTPETKRLLGPLAYPVGVVRHWRSQRPFTVAVRIENAVQLHRVIQVTIANGRFYGGGATAHEDARIDDALLDVVLIRPRPLPDFLLKLPRLRRGRYEGSPAVAYRAARCSIETRRRHAVSTDGEESTATPAEFRVLPRALEVFVPDEPH
ncbi:MAG TPA: lipid kinase [Gammaproteobacteria bacterium]|nr:lipid kinase [Gammaproteobacteria bacterium]